MRVSRGRALGQYDEVSQAYRESLEGGLPVGQLEILFLAILANISSPYVGK